MLKMSTSVSLLAVLGATVIAQSPAPNPQAAVPSPLLVAAQNPYRLEPYHADFPVELEYPPRHGVEYARTRRQILERLAGNLAGGGRAETWHVATEFFWRAPEDAVEPLVATMDRAFSDPALADVVRNCIEAMARMGGEVFDAPLRRALQHKEPNVVQAAFAAFATAGKPATLRELAGAFAQMDGRARQAWVRGVRTRLGDEAVPLLRDVMAGPYTVGVRDQVLQQALLMPLPQAAEILKVRWNDAVGEFKAIIAGVLHATGDTSGTTWLADALQSEDMATMTIAIKHCRYGELGPLRERLLRASTHLRPEIRIEVANALTHVEGDDVADVFEVMAAPDEPWEVRSIALRELTRRGRDKSVAILLDELPTATGTRLQGILNQLSASGDARAVPVLLERFQKAPDGEGRAFLQALSQNHSEAAARALLQVFAGPERVVHRAHNGAMTTRNYLPTLLLNLRGSERLVLAAFVALPATEWQQRAHLLSTLSGFAADRPDTKLQQECIAPLRQVLFDQKELPQLRLLALNLLTRRWLTIDDVLRLKNQRATEAPGMRALLADFLTETF